MNVDDLKRQAAQAALDLIPEDIVLGIGTGSTINIFIEELVKKSRNRYKAVPSSSNTRNRLLSFGIEILELADVDRVAVYIDGVDQVNKIGQCIKGGKGALTGEKIVRAKSDEFICIADESKVKDAFGVHFVPIEVIPMARGLVAIECIKLGGTPKLRQDYKTEYGNYILDVDFRLIENPISLERAINNIPGVVTCGLFALNPATTVIIGTNDGPKISKINMGSTDQ